MTVERGIYGGRKIREGTVVSDKMEKTVVVAVQSNIRHPLYKKTIRRVRKFMAHDENGQAKMGDTVRIVEAGPTSRRKRWQLTEVLSRAELPEVAPGAIDLDILGEVKAEEEASVAEVAEVADAAVEAPVAVAEPVAAEEAAEEPEPQAAVEEETPAEESAPEPAAAEAAPEATDAGEVVGDEAAPAVEEEAE